MKRTGRLDAVCAELSACGLFADVGCDHGYCTLYMLERGLCRGAVISDISAKSLKKAETLLAAYIEAGRVRSAAAAGLDKTDPSAELVLILHGGPCLIGQVNHLIGIFYELPSLGGKADMLAHTVKEPCAQLLLQ